MKIFETESIVLKTMDFKERDCILTFLTKDEGKKTGILFRGKSMKQGNAAKSELFVRQHLEFSEKSGSEFVKIRKCELLESHPKLRQDYSKFLHAAYLAELMLFCDVLPEESTQYYDLFSQTLLQLSSTKQESEIKLSFELALLQLIGITPDFGNCMHCGNALWKKDGLRSSPAFSSACQLDAVLGGLRCPTCLMRGNDKATLHPGSLAFLQAKRNNNENGTKVKPTRNNLKELDFAFYVYFRHYFGRDLKSHKLLRNHLWKK